MKIFVLLAVLATASAEQPVGILEDLLTTIAQLALKGLDPASVSYTELHITSHEDTDLFFIFKDAQISNFSNIVITGFDPILETWQFTASAQLERFVAHADNYTTKGILKGLPYSTSGTMDFAANHLEAVVSLRIARFTFTPFQICLAEQSLRVDLTGKSFEANFENADELNAEMNAHGAELVAELQEKIRAHADDVINWVNFIFCDRL
ncbi:uncharacterized protein LOC135196291 isoform X2 [Macrobrachium nipponense]